MEIGAVRRGRPRPAVRRPPGGRVVARDADRHDPARAIGHGDGLRPVRRREGRDPAPPPRVRREPGARGDRAVVVAHRDEPDRGQGDVEQVGLPALVGLRMAERSGVDVRRRGGGRITGRRVHDIGLAPVDRHDVRGAFGRRGRAGCDRHGRGWGRNGWGSYRRRSPRRAGWRASRRGGGRAFGAPPGGAMDGGSPQDGRGSGRDRLRLGQAGVGGQQRAPCRSAPTAGRGPAGRSGRTPRSGGRSAGAGRARR